MGKTFHQVKTIEEIDRHNNNKMTIRRSESADGEPMIHITLYEIKILPSGDVKETQIVGQYVDIEALRYICR